MENKAFNIARQALTSIEFYRGFYASSEPSQKHFNEVLDMLRRTAENMSAGESYSDKKFLLAFADALEVANTSGEYISPLKK